LKRNKLREIWADGGVVLNGWMHIPSTWSAEIMAHAGWDSLTIDLQHGMHSIETAIQMIQAINTTKTTALARVNWNEPGSIMRLLDAGASGIICPMVNTREACEAFVGACRYPPVGYRSLGPTRARIVMGADYAQHANDEILSIAMVETREAVENVEAIAGVAGLDMLFVGLGDLCFSLTGGIGLDSADQQLDEALSKILAACEKQGLLAGIFTASPAFARGMIERGFRFVTVKSDTMILGEFSRQLIQETKQGHE